jgi:bifunctional DNA-binding transcriptional regulator/antitoxin component of YhaV-PrlF toxin-antitoxin module
MMTTPDTRYEVLTQTDKDDVIIPIPPELLKKLGWKEGDSIEFGIDETGRYILKKVQK